MATIFAGIPGVVVYLDDIVVHGGKAAIHDERLSRVLDVLTHHNLTLNGEKCIFAAPVIEIVGFCLSTSGLSPLHSNVDAILCLPEPTAQLSSFLGMTTFYLRFLPRYSETTAPLRAPSSSWMHPGHGPPCSAAVRKLKSQLTSPPVVAHFDPQSPTFVTCDASNTAVGAVLSQLQKGSKHPMAFASRSLTPAEQSRHFTLRTDHQALMALLATTGSDHKPLHLYRWSERLQFTPGRENIVADLLSRAAPCSALDTAQDPQEPELIVMLGVVEEPYVAWGRNDLLSLSVEQDSDNSLSLKLLLCLEMALCSG
ncbi:hypothetical protein L3Q82_008317 [Scortum barcoo]|uniref:Uncharacterized protein n=1 Tax=Scortum barcoo TaxID=214431 RepID=A0ACB8WHF7_9TELE|nr:hypothetical protein L3Q82_008317 [Scortum barcoo]